MSAALFPKASFSEFDPFLLLDEIWAHGKLAPGQAKGAPDHPHRGFETVTYLLLGEMEHKDSKGARRTLEGGRRAVDDRRGGRCHLGDAEP